jgi:hypothetical protein
MTPDHERLLGEMNEFITGLGGSSYSAAYADILPADKKAILANVHSVPATYIRTRSDRVCFFPNGSVFEYDAKTTTGENFYIECLPALHHLVVRRWFNIPTIYGFRWISGADMQDIGIVLDDYFRELVDAVDVFDRPQLREVSSFIESNYKNAFPNSELRKLPRIIGSGDPAIRIRRSKLSNMRGWKEVIRKMAGQL